MKQYKNYTNALKYIQVAHQTKGGGAKPYDKLFRGSLHNWFKTIEELHNHA